MRRGCVIAWMAAMLAAAAVRAGPSAEEMGRALARLVSLTDNHIQFMLEAVSALADSPEVQSGDWERIRPLMAQLESYAVECVPWFALPDGSYYTPDKGLTDQNLKDREYFPDLMAGRSVNGPLVVSKSTGRKSVIVAVPVWREGTIIGALGASVFLDDLSRQVRNELALPEDWIFFALNPDGRTTLNFVPERVFLDPRDQGSPSMSAAMDEILETGTGEVSYEFDGRMRHVLFDTSPLTGWRFAVGTTEPTPLPTPGD